MPTPLLRADCLDWSASMSLPDPRFPDGFHGRPVARETAPFAEACRLAKCQKAEPGDLFYSRRHGMASCALLMDADRPVAEIVQSLPLAQLAVAESLSGLSSAARPSAIWPFGIGLNGREVARVAIGGLSGNEEEDDYPDWLVIGLHIRLSGKFIERLGKAGGRDLTALAMEGIEIDRTVMLERLAKALQRRQFEWQEDGFAPIRSEWMSYAACRNDRRSIQMDMEGNAMIASGEGFERVSLIDMIPRQLPLHLAA